MTTVSEVDVLLVEIRAESEPGRGSAFCFALPVATLPIGSDLEGASQGRASAHPHEARRALLSGLDA